MAESDPRPITQGEVDPFDLRFTAWLNDLTDRERRILGTTLQAALTDDDVRGHQFPTAAMPAPYAGPIIGAALQSVAAIQMIVVNVRSQNLAEQAEPKGKGRTSS